MVIIYRSCSNMQPCTDNYVRHPMYTGVIWSSLANEQNLSFLLSIQSVGHMLVSCVTSLYVILAVRYFEEPALMKSMTTNRYDILEIQCCLIRVCNCRLALHGVNSFP